MRDRALSILTLTGGFGLSSACSRDEPLVPPDLVCVARI